MPAPFEPRAVANEILDAARVQKISVTPLQLMKLAYFAHGWHTVLAQKPLLAERFEAWQYGPVCESVYHAFKEYGSAPIARKFCPSDELDEDGLPVVLAPELPSQDPDADFAREIIRRVVTSYGRHSGPRLSELSHQEGGAWWKAWHDRGGSEIWKTDLLQEDIKAEFEGYRKKGKS